MLNEAINHVVEQVSRTRIETEPFSHVVVDNVFPDSFYSEIQRHMMPDSGYQPLSDTGRVAKRYSRSRLCYAPTARDDTGPPQQRFWYEVFKAFYAPGFVKFWVALFRSQIVERLANDPELSPLINEISFAPEMFLMRDVETYSLGPHTDSARKAISILVYLPPDDRSLHLGTSLYRPKDSGFRCKGGPHYGRQRFELVKTVDFKPNRIFAFPKTDACFHGVEPVPGRMRRDLLLFDIFLNRPEGSGPAA